MGVLTKGKLTPGCLWPPEQALQNSTSEWTPSQLCSKSKESTSQLRERAREGSNGETWEGNRGHQATVTLAMSMFTPTLLCIRWNAGDHSMEHITSQTNYTSLCDQLMVTNYTDHVTVTWPTHHQNRGNTVRGIMSSNKDLQSRKEQVFVRVRETYHCKLTLDKVVTRMTPEMRKNPVM